MSKVEDIRAIPDTRERAAAAAKRIRALNKDIAAHRVRRNHAMLTLLREPYTWPKTKIVRHVGVSRTMFVGVVSKAPAELPPVKGDPDVVAKREHDKSIALQADVDALLTIRDAAILDLLYDEKLPNHLVATITGELEERIAQLRSSALPA